MTNPKVLIAIGTLVLAAALVSLVSRPLGAQSGTSSSTTTGAPVTIVSPLPVPVSGSVGVSGNVGITGTPSVNVANTTASPVPVAVVPNAAPYAIQAGDQSINLSNWCHAAISALDVQRVVYDPTPRLASPPFQSTGASTWQVAVGVSAGQLDDPSIGFIAMLGPGELERNLSVPVRITNDQFLHYRGSCTGPLAPVSCATGLYFIGVPHS